MHNFLIFFLASLIYFSSAWTQRENPERSFAVSFGYLERLVNSNEALVDFPLSVIESYGALYDLSTSKITDPWWARLIAATLELPISYWLTTSLMVSFHEFGHARGVQALGANYYYHSQGYGQKLGGRISSYWGLSFWRLITPPAFFPGAGGASTVFYGEASLSKGLYNYWTEKGSSISVIAGGLNNQMYLAKKIAQRVNQNHGHIVHAQHYVFNKLYQFIYSKLDRNLNPNDDPEVNNSGDISMLINMYKDKKYNITHKHIELQSLLSLLSGTAFSFLRAYYEYILLGNTRVRPFEFYGFRIPDLNSYITTQGLSFEIYMGYIINPDLLIDLSYEFVWRGRNTHQVAPAIRYNIGSEFPKLGKLWLESDLVISRGVGGSIGADWRPYVGDNLLFWQRLSYFMNLLVHNGYTLYGERNGAYWGNSSFSFSGFFGVKINY